MHNTRLRVQCPETMPRAPSPELSAPLPVLATPGNDVPSITLVEEAPMHGIIYLVGLIVVVMFILSFLGLR